MKHINGLLKPTPGLGDGRREGHPRDVSTATLARKVGIAFQNPDHQLFSDSVENEVTFALKNFGFDERADREAARLGAGFFGLEAVSKVLAAVLSGGEKKRLTLACILAWDPEVVVLDEPTVGQDALQKEKLAEIFRMLHSTGKTIIIVSHDVEFLWTLQPRLLVMKQGSGRRGRALLDCDARQGAPRGREGHPAPAGPALRRARRSRPERPFLDVSDARSWIGRGEGLDDVLARRRVPLQEGGLPVPQARPPRQAPRLDRVLRPLAGRVLGDRDRRGAARRSSSSQPSPGRSRG